MKSKILDALITLVQYLLIIFIALLVFVYVVVPLADKHRTEYYYPDDFETIPDGEVILL